MTTRIGIAMAALGMLAAPPLARAQSLQLRSVEFGPWPAAVAALQADRSAEGRIVHVYVLDERGGAAPCGSYELSLDAAGASALRILGCDASDGTTAIQLVSRTALFSHDGHGPVPVPRQIQLAVTEVRTGAAAGGAALTGGSALSCSVHVRPYLDDLEHGGHVALTPDRYEVRLRAADVHAQPASDGWLLTSGGRAELALEYDVVERATGEVVLHDHATLQCASGPAAQPGVAARAPVAPLVAASSRWPGRDVVVTRWGRRYQGIVSGRLGGDLVVLSADGQTTTVPWTEVFYAGPADRAPDVARR